VMGGHDSGGLSSIVTATQSSHYISIPQWYKSRQRFQQQVERPSLLPTIP